MSIFTQIAERRILEAIQKGLLDDLSIKGQPIRHEDLSMVPEELRMGYKILKNAGFIPEELQLRKQILSLQDLINTSVDSEEKSTAERKLTLRRLQLDMLMEKKGRSLSTQDYQEKLEARLLK